MVKSRSLSNAGSSSRRAADILGLVFFFTGAACLLWLTFNQSAPVPDIMVRCLRILAGSGAFAIPVILMFIGAMFLVGYDRLAFNHSTAGSAILFLAFVTGRHISALSGSMPSLAENPGPVMEAGGVIGGAFGILFVKLLGTTTSYLLLIALACVAVVLIVERPFVEVLHFVFQRPANAGLAAAKQGAGFVKQKTIGSKTPIASRKALPPGLEDEEAQPEPRKRSLFSFLGKRPDSDSAPEHPNTRTPDHPESQQPNYQTAQRPRTKAHRPAPLAQPPFPSLDAETGGTGDFKLPPLSLLNQPPPPPKKGVQEMAEKIKVLEQTLEHFNIQSEVVEVAHGPTVTRYEIQLAPGIKVSKIVSLADNLAMALAAIDVRVEAPIPGKSAIGVEVPNPIPALVSLRESIDTPDFWNAPSKLTFCLGKDVAGQNRYADLAKMPHLLVAGSTNSGKSICLNTLIASILYRATPDDVKFLMIDPKRVELSLWDGIPHLMHPVVKDVKQAAGLFRAALKEMDRRYDQFARLQTRNIDGYNQRVPADERLPYIVIFVDELADLMMQMGAEVETSICRLAQLARATGIHLVIATQRPSVDVITGLIKANISSRIAFAVSSSVDSRTILDMNGAERLIGRGDMLFMPIDASKPMRIQGCFLSEHETNALVSYLKEQGPPQYSIMLAEPGESGYGGGSLGGDDEVDDELFEACVKLVVTNGQASTSMLQRRFKIGYTRAARIVDVMQERGIVGPPDGAKPREILMTRLDAERLFHPANNLDSEEYE